MISLIILIVLYLYFKPFLDFTKDGLFLWYDWRNKRKYVKL